ncbi:MAG: hypothetical protein N2746_08570 [Deltaproteobacteria bacterium]|nr:hypothetical protein [Deltaproteobacteria bacterium]
MRKALTLLTIILSTVVSINSFADLSVEVGLFYDALAPYGDWIYLETYGVWVWRPVGLWVGWQPYTYGRWEWSEEYGWIWVSYFEWGWAPFHYGRWFYHDYYGWVWVPGTVWRPHWVVWIHSGPYVGWYPLCPSFIYIDYYSPVVYERWIIVEAGEISSGRYHHNAIPLDKKAQIFGSTSGVHKYIPKEEDTSYHNYGPPKSEIERYSSKKIEPIRTDFINKPISIFNLTEKRYQIYKPDFKTNISDMGRLSPILSKESNSQLNPVSKNYGLDNKGGIVFSPKYTEPLGNKNFNKGGRIHEGDLYNKYEPGTGIKNGLNTFQYQKGGSDSKSIGNSGKRIFRDESIKSFSPNSTSNQKIFTPPSSSDDDDDSTFKKGVPKFSPKGATVPKSLPQLKGK